MKSYFFTVVDDDDLNFPGVQEFANEFNDALAHYGNPDPDQDRHTYRMRLREVGDLAASRFENAAFVPVGINVNVLVPKDLVNDLGEAEIRIEIEKSLSEKEEFWTGIID